MNFKEYLQEAKEVVQVSTYSGEYIGFTAGDIKNELKHMDVSADSIVGWLYRFLVDGIFPPDFKYPKSRIKKQDFFYRVIEKILHDILEGKIKKITFGRDLSTIKGLNLADYN